MTVTAVHKDPDALSMTITSEFDATPERIWQLWADRDQLQRWWGPPTYPATFPDYDLRSDAPIAYYMTGPDGQKSHGWWRILEADKPRSIALLDGFSNPDGTPNDALPTMTMRVTIEDAGVGRSRMAIRTEFPNAEAMERVLAMGMEQGMTLALGQIDEILGTEPVGSARH
jgi:uncharacterized protein YndB with AHSA1/START domain